MLNLWNIRYPMTSVSLSERGPGGYDCHHGVSVLECAGQVGMTVIMASVSLSERGPGGALSGERGRKGTHCPRVRLDLPGTGNSRAKNWYQVVMESSRPIFNEQDAQASISHPPTKITTGKTRTPGLERYTPCT
ncbi:hypothetical protein RRG08_053448 [Elysia crispata]|uniref:Uncharacterized protein n=1 Tax=Elysia crispata TaxID=231223 RepID=A0AAE0ZGE6_9GAST|nr:hypothetical protein RRG08_053448 [Elysia crispata]